MATSIALITGASSGIGAAFARRLAAAWAVTAGKFATLPRAHLSGLPAFDELWLVARRVDMLEKLAEELRAAAPGLTVVVVGLDLTMAGAITGLAERIGAGGSALAILVNNAGYGVYGPFADAPLERQLGEIDLNCRALTELAGRLGPYLVAGSLVINVASLAAFQPLGNFAVYAATKAYVFSFSMALSAEWRPRGIRVNALCPGPVETEFGRVASSGARADVLHGVDADVVVAACLRSAVRGCWSSIPRFSWRLTRLIATLAGPRLSAALTFSFMNRPQAARPAEPPQAAEPPRG